MGALHEGHLSLVRAALTAGLPVVVSVFVNPTQFDDDVDLAGYRRELDLDVARAADAGAAAVFAPSVDVVYPDGFDEAPNLPAIATEPGLEDAHRSGHFRGVCQVVARLFDLVRPRLAIFGEKDWQQLQVITQLVAEHGERWPGLAVRSHPTVRCDDGLAMSSRSTHLGGADRQRAVGLPAALDIAADGEAAMLEVLASHGLEVDYAVVRDAATLLEQQPARPRRALIAARLDSLRLIDNTALEATA